ncbi:hypothetical protein VIGAN_04177400, partial [Vigna angularis var. angularis]
MLNAREPHLQSATYRVLSTSQGNPKNSLIVMLGSNCKVWEFRPIFQVRTLVWTVRFNGSSTTVARFCGM